MISIIIPNYNGLKTIGKTIKSINSSRLKNYEIIVVDNASTDGSIEYLKKLKGIRIFKNKKNLGASRARNVGIRKSKGEILIFIDCDAWFEKGSLKRLANISTGKDITFPKINFENGECFYPCFKYEKKYPHISCCFGIKKESLKKLDEFFDETFETYLEDTDFFIRCKINKLNAAYFYNAVVTHSLKEDKDFGHRYYLEIRNLFYGIKKLKNIIVSDIYNPFKFSTIFKCLLFGSFNFAWFNWSGYSRRQKKLSSNKIFLNNRLDAFKLFFRALNDSRNLRKIAAKKNKKLKAMLHVSSKNL